MTLKYHQVISLSRSPTVKSSHSLSCPIMSLKANTDYYHMWRKKASSPCIWKTAKSRYGRYFCMANNRWLTVYQNICQLFFSWKTKNSTDTLFQVRNSETDTSDMFGIILDHFFILCTHLASICFLLNVKTFININAWVMLKWLITFILMEMQPFD